MRRWLLVGGLVRLSLDRGFRARRHRLGRGAPYIYVSCSRVLASRIARRRVVGRFRQL